MIFTYAQLKYLIMHLINFWHIYIDIDSVFSIYFFS